jgi:uncharacterized protein (DUF1684 family)
VIHLHHSGDRLAIRLRDPESKLRTRFTGLRWFPVDARWRVDAAFARFDKPRTLQMQNVLGDAPESESPGETVFTVEGRTVRLLAFKGGAALVRVSRRHGPWRDLSHPLPLRRCA